MARFVVSIIQKNKVQKMMIPQVLKIDAVVRDKRSHGPFKN